MVSWWIVAFFCIVAGPYTSDVIMVYFWFKYDLGQKY